jgi:hypothetical protein
MVTVRVGMLREDQYTFWAKLDAKAAAFAAFLDHMDDPMRHLHAVSIQWLSPIYHTSSFDSRD